MIAIIPAKKNSSRLKNKNIKIFNGKPLIFYTIKAALKSRKVTRVIVSTDCKNISKISKKYGAEVLFKRPQRLCKKNTSIKDVCIHLINFLERKQKVKIPELLILQPTSPLRKSDDINKAINLYQKSISIDYLTTFCKTKPIEWIFYKKNRLIYEQAIKGMIKNSQELKQSYILNGSIYIIKRKVFFKKDMKFNNIAGIEIPYERSIDIDNSLDFFLAEKINLKK